MEIKFSLSQPSCVLRLLLDDVRSEHTLTNMDQMNSLTLFWKGVWQRVRSTGHSAVNFTTTVTFEN